MSETGENKKVVILHSNDIHGDFLPQEIDGKQVGGIARLSGYVNQVKAERDNVIYAIAGDLFRGSIIDSEYKGISTIELANFLAPDVVTLGNHEVDYGVSHLLFLEKCAKFPIINSNLYIKTNHVRLFKPYHIINVGGINIMFIGVLTEEVLASTRSEELIGSFVDIWQAAKEVGVIIDNYKTTKIDYTVLLTHIGFDQDQKLAELIDPDWGVDLIIGAHTHTLLTEPVYVNGIPIVQAGTGSHQIGRIDLEFDENNHLSNFKYKIVPIDEDQCPEDEAMKNVLYSYKDKTDAIYKRIITNFRRPLTHPHRNMETELGNLFADLLQVDSSFDVMFVASGGIRKQTMGPIVTYQDLKECVPYDNPVVMLEVTGAQFKRIIRHMVRDEAYEDGHTEWYQLSKGVHIVYDRKTKEFEEFQLNGKDVEDDQIIKIGVEEGYHLNGFTEFFGVPIEEVLANKKPRKVITSSLAIFEELLVSSNNVDSHIEDRLVIKNRDL